MVAMGLADGQLQVFCPVGASVPQLYSMVNDNRLG